MDLLRLYDFASGQPIKSSEVDDELNQLVAGHNAQEDALEILGAYNTLIGASAIAAKDLLAGSYFVAADPSEGFLINSGVDILSTAGFAPSTNELPVKYLDADEYAVTGRSARLRVRGVLSRNTVEPGITFTFGLYPVTFAGGGDALTATLGAVVAGSTVAVTSTPAVTTTSGVSAEFAVPTDGLYALGVALSGTLVNNSACLLAAALQQRWV